MAKKNSMRLDEIIAHLGGELKGDGSVEVSQVAALASAKPGDIAFLSNPKLRAQLKETKASALIIAPQFAAETELPCIVFGNAYAYYARVVALLNPRQDGFTEVHPSAVVASPVPASSAIGAKVVIGNNVRIGENVVIYPGCVIGDDVEIGDNSLLYPNVVIYQRCILGARVVIQAGAIIGSDGFGFANEAGRWIKIPQIGRVIIGDDVEIGANTTIDRGALDDTEIGRGVKLDNQIQIAHNIVIGENTAMAGCVGIAGSTKIGANCTIGGAAMIGGHIEIADRVTISAATAVWRSISEPGFYAGIFPVEKHENWVKTAIQIKRLGSLSKRVSELEKKANN